MSHRDPPALAARWFPAPPVTLHTPGAGAGRFSTVEEARAFLAELARAPGARLERLGASSGGCPIEALVVEGSGPDPIRVLVQARAHGDEPAGTEGALELAYRLLAGRPGRRAGATVMVVPVLNPDGARALSRRTAGNRDPNRDFLRSESTVTRAVLTALRRFDPEVVADLHEHTVWGRMGDPHEASATTAPTDAMALGPNQPNLLPALRGLTTERFVGGIGRTLAAAGLRFAPYRLLLRDGGERLRVRAPGPGLLSGRNAIALGGRVSVLVESRGIGIGTQHLVRRTYTQYLAARSVVETASAHAAAVRSVTAAARARAAAGGRWILRLAPRREEVRYPLLVAASNEVEPVRAVLYGGASQTPTATLEAPRGYVLPPGAADLVASLERLGVRTEPLEALGPFLVEVLRVRAFERGRGRLFGGHDAGRTRDHRIAVAAATEPRRFPSGSRIASTAQPNALYLLALEPESRSSFAAQSHWGEGLEAGFEFPVYRLR